MKKHLLFFMLLANSFLFAQEEWRPLGPDDFTELSNITATEIRIAIDNNNVPYIAYRDGDNANKATVRKFNGTSWEIVGTAGFSAGEVFTNMINENIHMDIAIDNNNVPYVVYSDGANAGKATIQKFNGTSWEVVGNLGFSYGRATYLNISIDTDNVPYVAFTDLGINGGPMVWKFNGTIWDFLGTTETILGEQADWTAMALDSNNKPYVAFAGYSYSTTKGLVVRKWDDYDQDFTWNASFGVSIVLGTREIAIAIDANNVPYVMYGDGLAYRTSTVQKFNGTAWELVGNRGFSDNHQIYYPDIAIGTNNVPYVVYQNGAQLNLSGGQIPPSQIKGKVTVKKFNGTAWEVVGTSGFSTHVYTPALEAHTSIAIDGNNVPYVAYINGGKAYVKYFGTENTLSTNDNASSLTKTTIYPNPVASAFSISGNEFVEEIAIYDVMGKKVLHEKQVNQTINIEHLSKGIYLAKIKTANDITTVKLIKE